MDGALYKRSWDDAQEVKTYLANKARDAGAIQLDILSGNVAPEDKPELKAIAQEVMGIANAYAAAVTANFNLLDCDPAAPPPTPEA